MIQPIADRVLVKVTAVSDTTTGGILLSEGSQEEKSEGVIVAVGTEVKYVQVGDVCLYGKYCGNEVTIDEVKHRIMKEYDIIGVEV